GVLFASGQNLARTLIEFLLR
uniref:Cytosol aminopeptidase (Fragments) n=1 Tax=Mesocricetus auratus TaxID=10036 RepID=AMPL_MESAU|nr:RecName: Full=Cytosol aminopeptidase; AltName: Full=Cysteinylglycine-S-conjugate dipeptidase; AltName: Full=Leucine aminopeptidase 3; Short=LAP-3; AltName: Full=Leucyl aminopeptidase; AltName: Full=Peptidase S; AltName: Full=Proline aminopeptidase; AltName: Full=Prolyl aminopeptidase [Mesocricetus auratus]